MTKSCSSVATLEAFVNHEAKRLWRGNHLKESIAKMHRFCAFESYGSRHLDTFKPADIYAFSDHLIDIGVSKNTVNHYFAAISMVFRHAVDMQLIDNAPKVRWHKVKDGRPRYMTPSELEKLETFFSNHQESWMRDFTVLAVNTGMRLGEILKITPDSVRTDQDGTWVYLEDTKNGDDRWVPLNSRALEALEALSFNPATHYNHRKFYDTWGEARRRIARGDKTFVFHVLRHTAASTMANELGVNTIIIAQLLGHRSQRTTAKYVHSKPKTLQDIAKQLGS